MIENEDMRKLKEKLEFIYQIYPRKLGKTPGFKTLMKQIKTEEELDSLERAIKNYRIHLEKSGTDPKFIMYFSTFANQWRDWLEENQGEVMSPAKQDKWSQLKERG